MILNYVKSESANYPELIDTTSSKKYVYIRKDVVEVQKEIRKKEVTYYQYQEAKLTHEEYEQYLKEISGTETLGDIENLKAENEMLMNQIDMLTNCILEMSEMLYA